MRKSCYGEKNSKGVSSQIKPQPKVEQPKMKNPSIFTQSKRFREGCFNYHQFY